MIMKEYPSKGNIYKPVLT